MVRPDMRSITKQDTIGRARLKLIKIAIFQNKAVASKRPKMRDGWLSTKVIKCRIECRKI
jgi:hypothetical protein